MSKYFALYKTDKNNYNALLAISDDLWLVELFIVQRKLDKKKLRIDKCKLKELPPFSDKNLIYYFGYPVTEYEYNFITNNQLEYESEIERSIYTLESGLIMYEKYLSSKEEKDIKKTIKMLKKKKNNLGNNKKFAKTMLETIIDRRGYLVDYMDNMQKFIDCMEG
jgi:hypothetical protein